MMLIINILTFYSVKYSVSRGPFAIFLTPVSNDWKRYLENVSGVMAETAGMNVKSSGGRAGLMNFFGRNRNE